MTPINHKEDLLAKQAVTLVSAAGTNATNMLETLLDKFPSLQEIDVKHWNFVLTVAGVFIAASRLNSLRLGDIREERLMETVSDSLAEWNPDGIRGFKDCKDLFESEYNRLTGEEHKARFIITDALGKWIVWNVLGKAPKTQDERNLVRSTGGMVTYTFSDWWKEGGEVSP